MSATEHWLMKSEPSVYSIDDLKKDKKTYWDGVRNFQARNFMKDTMKVGDLVIFYHSNAEPSAAVGVAQVCKKAYPDFTAWDKKDDHYDPKSTPEKPLWFMVDIQYVKTFKNPVSLESLKACKALKDMMVVKPGVRLSVQPVSETHFNQVCSMGDLS